MSDTIRPPTTFKDVAPLVCAVVSVGFIITGAIRSDGGRDKQIDDNTRRIERLETADQTKTDLLSKIDGRTIRIETKLELIVPTKDQAK